MVECPSKYGQLCHGRAGEADADTPQLAECGLTELHVTARTREHESTQAIPAITWRYPRRAGRAKTLEKCNALEDEKHNQKLVNKTNNTLVTRTAIMCHTVRPAVHRVTSKTPKSPTAAI
jgi:hypothetical protein